MAGVHGQVLGHLLRRGIDADYIQRLQNDAELYDKSGPENEIDPLQMLPIVITILGTLLVLAGVKYSIGQVMAALTMIESPTSIALVADKPPAYADEPDAPLEKEPLMPSEAEADVEVLVVHTKPITAKISTTMAHLSKTGGFRGRFRGAKASALYHFLHVIVTNFFISALGLGLVGNAFVYVFVSIGLARVHMAWTHSMIATPSPKPFWKRLVPRQQSKAILLPTLVHALAEQATVILPIVVAFAVGLPDIESEHVMKAAHTREGCKMGLLALRVLAVPATAIFVAVAVLLPATVTLTRIEAALLPEDQETIVPFDRQALVSDLDLTAKGSSRAIFVAAWRSFDRASRWRLIKLYLKMAAIEIGVLVVSVHLIIAELYLVGGEKVALLFKSLAANVKLATISGQNEITVD